MPVPPVLLLLPGLLCDSRLWRDQAEPLGATLRCIVADLTQDDNLAAMAARALDAVPAGSPIALAGLSMGGYVAMEILRRAPARITRLALMDTSARADTPEQSRRRRGLLALSNSGQFRGVTPRLLPQLLHPSRLDGPLGEEVREMADRVGRDAFQRQQRAILARPDSRPDLPAIRVPTLVAVGDHDILTPPELAEEMAALIPGATLARIPDAAHLPPMETPGAVLRLFHAWLADPVAGPQPVSP
ncbi:MAG TPA: alpha/beta fold hydrolase [Falsiroseomonas sp.]|jgi:pimeloyl-ACP methyl ester carboxylesterase|nr:alpha/beta fold hydrolase [Falsiroseomonas sp.]